MTSKTSNLSARKEQVLCSIVKAFIETGEPVASGDISRVRRFGLSSASIRNVMAELAAEGYLYQPHTSAGRIPTGRAFQVFVESLPGRRVQQSEFGRIREALSDAPSLQDRIGLASHLLSEMTDGVSITAAVGADRQVLEQVHLVALGERRVLMILVTTGKLVRDQVVVLDEPVTQDELNSVRNYLSVNFTGWVITDVQRELRARLEATTAAYDLILKKLILLYQKGLLNVGSEPEVRMEGAANLVSFELHLTKERLKDLMRALEEKKLVLDLLERFLEQPFGEVGVHVGLEAGHPAMGELSIIGITVDQPGGTPARLAVLGPMRMDYLRAMSAVLHVGKAFGSLPS